MNESRIIIRNLTVLYEGNAALKEISLAIPDRQITAIIGPSGCGKTTLLKSINRLVDSTDGVEVSSESSLSRSTISTPKVSANGVAT